MAFTSKTVNRGSAKKRLLRDLHELRDCNEMLQTVNAEPEEDNFFVWHCNLRPRDGPYQGITFHILMEFPDNYPLSPPGVLLMTPFNHPNVYRHDFNNFSFQHVSPTYLRQKGHDAKFICLDMLKNYTTADAYCGWSRAYSVASILLQLQSFLFSENIPQEHGGSISRTAAHRSDRVCRDCRAFVCPRSGCSHTWTAPSPALQTPTNVDNSVYRVGERVEALWSGTWLDVEIEGRYGVGNGDDGTYKVRWGVDNMVSSKWPASKLRRKEATPKGKIGDRVKHDTRGEGIVKAQNDFSSRVQYDNGKLTWTFTSELAAVNKETLAGGFKPRDVVYATKPIESTARKTWNVAPGEEGVVRGPDSSKKPDPGWLNVLFSGKKGWNVLPTCISKEKSESKLDDANFPTLPNRTGKTAQAPLLIEEQERLLEEQQWARRVFQTDALCNEIMGFLTTRDIIICRQADERLCATIERHNMVGRREVKCFYSKEGYRDCQLGVGIMVENFEGNDPVTGKSNRGLPKEITSNVDYLSHDAFYPVHDDVMIRSGVWGEEINDWFPLIISPSHGARVQELLCSRIRALCPPARFVGQEVATNSPDRAFAESALNVLGCLMNSMTVMVVDTGNQQWDSKSQRSRYGDNPFGGAKVSAKLSMCEKAVLGYCSFHHMLLYLAKQYPLMREIANHRVRMFKVDRKHRHKMYSRDLGKLLVCLCLSDIGWEGIRQEFCEEDLTRSVFWANRNDETCKQIPNARSPTDYRPPRGSYGSTPLTRRFFDATLVGKRLTMFQIYFLMHIGRPQGSCPDAILQMYNNRLGRPTNAMTRKVSEAAARIMTITNWHDYHQMIGGTARITTDAMLTRIQDAYKFSTRCGYTTGSRGKYTDQGYLKGHTPGVFSPSTKASTFWTTPYLVAHAAALKSANLLQDAIGKKQAESDRLRALESMKTPTRAPKRFFNSKKAADAKASKAASYYRTVKTRDLIVEPTATPAVMGPRKTAPAEDEQKTNFTAVDRRTPAKTPGVSPFVRSLNEIKAERKKARGVDVRLSWRSRKVATDDSFWGDQATAARSTTPERPTADQSTTSELPTPLLIRRTSLKFAEIPLPTLPPMNRCLTSELPPLLPYPDSPQSPSDSTTSFEPAEDEQTTNFRDASVASTATAPAEDEQKTNFIAVDRHTPAATTASVASTTTTVHTTASDPHQLSSRADAASARLTTTAGSTPASIHRPEPSPVRYFVVTRETGLRYEGDSNDVAPYASVVPVTQIQVRDSGLGPSSTRGRVFGIKGECWVNLVAYGKKLAHEVTSEIVEDGKRMFRVVPAGGCYFRQKANGPHQCWGSWRTHNAGKKIIAKGRAVYLAERVVTHTDGVTWVMVDNGLWLPLHISHNGSSVTILREMAPITANTVASVARSTASSTSRKSSLNAAGADDSSHTHMAREEAAPVCEKGDCARAGIRRFQPKPLLPVLERGGSRDSRTSISQLPELNCSTPPLPPAAGLH